MAANSNISVGSAGQKSAAATTSTVSGTTGTGNATTGSSNTNSKPTTNSVSNSNTNSRSESVDVVRGLAMFFMVIADIIGTPYPMIGHAPWNGIHIADFVMPFFLFIVGFSLALSQKRVYKEYYPDSCDSASGSSGSSSSHVNSNNMQSSANSTSTRDNMNSTNASGASINNNHGRNGDSASNLSKDEPRTAANSTRPGKVVVSTEDSGRNSKRSSATGGCLQPAENGGRLLGEAGETVITSENYSNHKSSEKPNIVAVINSNNAAASTTAATANNNSNSSLKEKKLKQLRDSRYNIVKRSVKMFMIGILVQGRWFWSMNLSTFRIMGILQRIAIVYCFLGCLETQYMLGGFCGKSWFEKFEKRKRNDTNNNSRGTNTSSSAGNASNRNCLLRFYGLHLQPHFEYIQRFHLEHILVLATLAVYIAIVEGVTFDPENCRPREWHDGLDFECNVAGIFDQKILGLNHMYRKDGDFGFDPEGLLTTLGAIFTGYAGLYLGRFFVLVNLGKIKRKNSSSCSNSNANNGNTNNTNHGNSTSNRDMKPLFSDASIMILQHFLFVAVFLLVLGMFVCGYGFGIPLNKRMWSLNYNFCMCSYATFTLLLVYLFHDVYLPNLLERVRNSSHRNSCQESTINPDVVVKIASGSDDTIGGNSNTVKVGSSGSGNTDSNNSNASTNRNIDNTNNLNSISNSRNSTHEPLLNNGCHYTTNLSHDSNKITTTRNEYYYTTSSKNSGSSTTTKIGIDDNINNSINSDKPIAENMNAEHLLATIVDDEDGNFSSPKNKDATMAEKTAENNSASSRASTGTSCKKPSPIKIPSKESSSTKVTSATSGSVDKDTNTSSNCLEDSPLILKENNLLLKENMQFADEATSLSEQRDQIETTIISGGANNRVCYDSVSNSKNNMSNNSSNTNNNMNSHGTSITPPRHSMNNSNVNNIANNHNSSSKKASCLMRVFAGVLENFDMFFIKPFMFLGTNAMLFFVLSDSGAVGCYLVSSLTWNVPHSSKQQRRARMNISNNNSSDILSMSDAGNYMNNGGSFLQTQQEQEQEEQGNGNFSLDNNDNSNSYYYAITSYVMRSNARENPIRDSENNIATNNNRQSGKNYNESSNNSISLLNDEAMDTSNHYSTGSSSLGQLSDAISDIISDTISDTYSNKNKKPLLINANGFDNDILAATTTSNLIYFYKKTVLMDWFGLSCAGFNSMDMSGQNICGSVAPDEHGCPMIVVYVFIQLFSWVLICRFLYKKKWFWKI